MQKGTRKRILFVAHWYPGPANPHRGIFIKNHAKAVNTIADLLVLDFSISHSDSFYSKEISRSKVDGLDTIHVHVKSKYYKLLYYSIAYQKKLVTKALRKYNVNLKEFDLVQSNVVFPSGIIGLWLARKNGLPLVHMEHWSYIRTFLTKDIHRNKAKAVLRYASKVVVVSELLKRQLEGYCASFKIEVIPNVVSSHFHFMQHQSENKMVRFIAVANWQKPKNPFVFIEALKQVQSDHPEIKIDLTMVGEGVQLEEIKKSQFNYMIHFPGNIPNNQMQEYYNKADYFLHASDFETFSIVTVEALMSGLPVVASPVGIITEIIDKTNGVIVENNSNDWVRAIEQLMATEYDRQEISQKVSKQFTLKEVAAKFEQLYRSL